MLHFDENTQWPTNNSFVYMVKDLESTRDMYHGYAYIRTKTVFKIERNKLNVGGSTWTMKHWKKNY